MKKIPKNNAARAVTPAGIASIAAPLDNQLALRFEAMRAAFAKDRDPDFNTRLSRLLRLETLLKEGGEEFAAAISKDFGHRSRHETLLAEVLVALGSIRHTKRHLRGWMRARRVHTAAHFWPSKNRLLRQPLGVVGIVSPWNYPVQLALVPAAAALAAGNRVLLKPSELTPNTSALLSRLVMRHFKVDEFAVVEGDASVGRAFVGLPFDHLLFTGSTAVGRSVAVAAAQNLTPVTLELGGKSPAIIDRSADLDALIESLMFGKLLNAGQTCIAPDYVLLPKGMEEQLLRSARAAVARLYPDLLHNLDYSAIASQHHFDRIESLVQRAAASGARVETLVAAGAPGEPNQPRRMMPRLVFEVSEAMALMHEEIFGPVLPVVSYDSVDQAVDYVNRHDKPLALYWYGKDKANRDRVLRQTMSGGVTVNDALWHLSQEDQPFGGVGASGQGAYHGEFGFRTFSHEKPVFIQARLNGASLLYPPYGKRFEYMMNLLRRIV
jgi:coniferyl-aldehyde dehydrogenase